MTSELSIDETGTGRPVLILHGGGGPFTVAPIAAHLAGSANVLLPTHPGWNGVPRPDDIRTIADYAWLYVELLDERDLRDVAVIGSSLGGWIAAEIALRDHSDRVSSLVLIDAGGVLVEGEPMRDFFALDPRGVAEFSFHDPERFFRDPATMSPEQVAVQAANMATMRAVAGDPYMHDPGLLARLATLTVPTTVIWGESDRIFTPGYGSAYAAAIPGAHFELIAEAGHLPQLEQPATTFALIDAALAAR